MSALSGHHWPTAFARTLGGCRCCKANRAVLIKVVLNSTFNRLSTLYFASSDQRRLIRTDSSRYCEEAAVTCKPFSALAAKTRRDLAKITTSRQEKKESSAVTKERKG